MVDDQHLGVLHPPPGGVIEALAVGGAGPAHAVARVALHLVPDTVSRERGQVGERAVRGVLGPGSDLHELGPLGIVGEQAPGSLERQPQPPQAQVVAAALHEHGRKLPRHDGGHERDVLVDQLLLERDRVGRDHHPAGPLPGSTGRRTVVPVGVGIARIAGGRPGNPHRLGLVGRGREHRRHEVGQALARAGARLDDRMPASADRLGHEPGHLQLLRPRLPARQPRRQPAVRPQEFIGSEHEESVKSRSQTKAGFYRQGLSCLCNHGLRGVARAPEPALLASAGRMPKRSQHRVNGGQDGQSERPGDGDGQPRACAARD